jgi:glycogen debranching enzyme
MVRRDDGSQRQGEQSGRLPEAFAGYDRSFTEYPVEYPTACSPQAWSAGTPLLLLRTMLRLDTSGQFLVSDPAVPPTIERLTLLDIPGRWGRADAMGRSQQHSVSRRSADDRY